MKIAIFGDAIGRPGRKAVMSEIAALKDSIDFFIVNGENASGGIGLTPETAKEFFDNGVDIITSGNHIWNKKEMVSSIDNFKTLLRPNNYPDAPGRGYCVVNKNGYRLGVLNLQGRTFMPPIDCPFKSADAALSAIGSEADAVIVDFHAEATSEKVALGKYLDGRVAALVGTHTHVQTSDERILSNGTAYMTDLGMCGPMDSVIGMTYDAVIKKFLTALPVHFEIGKGDISICGAIIEINHSTGKATNIERINKIYI